MPLPETPPPPQTEPAASTEARFPWKRLTGVVFDQAWGLCVAYLGLGLGAELLRRFQVASGAKLQQYLDGLPFLALRRFGFLEQYLSAVALGSLSPFWNRVLLSSITLAAILLQAMIIGFTLMLLWRGVRRFAR